MVARLMKLASWRSGVRGLVYTIDNFDFVLVVAAAILCLVMLSHAKW